MKDQVTDCLPCASVKAVFSRDLTLKKTLMSAKRAAGPLSGSSDEEDEDKDRTHQKVLPDTSDTTSGTASLTNGAKASDSGKCTSLPSPAAIYTSPHHQGCVDSFGISDSSRQFRRPKQKKKKAAIGSVETEDAVEPKPAPPKTPKQRRDYLPMRMRALPQSFWQQPNHPHSISPGAQCHRVLPPLFLKDGGLEEDIEALRPVSPQIEKEGRDRDKARPPRVERNLTVANPDLLYKLFEHVEEKKAAHVSSSNGGGQLAPVHPHARRGRPKRALSSNKSLLMGDDPYLMETVTSKLFPHLSIDAGRSSSSSTSGIGAPNVSVQLITIHEGDKCVTLPSLCVEQNYSQMLSELASHI